MQVTHEQAQKIATQAATTAQGFGKASEEQMRFAVRAAWLALEAAGCLNDAKAADAKRNAAKANAARNKQRRICAAHGLAF